MFYWILGINFSHLLMWVIFTIIPYLIIMFKLKSYNWDYTDRISLEKYKKSKKKINIITITVLTILLSVFIINKDKVYGYKVQNLNTIDYNDMLQKVREEFNPDDGLIYSTESIHLVYNQEHKLTSLNISFFIFKNNSVYRLNVKNISNSIIIRENNLGESWVDALKTISYPINENNYLTSINRLDLSYYISNTTIENDNIVISFDSTRSQYYKISDDFNNKGYIIDKSGNVIKITSETELESTKYYHFYILNYDKNGIPINLSQCFIER